MRNYILIKMKGKRITKNLLFEYLCFDKNIRKGNFADRQKLTACTVMNSFWLFNAVIAPILSDDLFKIEGISTRQKGKRIPQACLIASYLNIFALTKIFSRAIFGNAKKSTACTVEDTVRILLYKILILRNSYFSSFNDAIAPYILKSKSTLPDVKTVH